MIFVSYAGEDDPIVHEFVDFIQLGAGVSHTNIFCSAQKGSIRNGANFAGEILQQINCSDLVIAVVSKAYMVSPWCVAELGAALSRKEAGSADFHMLLIPPFSPAKLEGFLSGRQALSIADRAALGEIRETIVSKIGDPVPLPRWDEKRDKFLRWLEPEIAYRQAAQLSRRIRLQGLTIERSRTDTYKLKLRITLQNNTDRTVTIRRAIWDQDQDGIPFRGPHGLHWQLKSGFRWSAEQPEIEAPAGAVLRTWIGLEETVEDSAILLRAERRRLGMLNARITLGADEILFELRL